MNIGIFTDTYYPQINGVATSIRMLEKELIRLGHKVYIFTTSDPLVDTISPNIFRLPSIPFIFFPAGRVALLASPKLLLKLNKLELDIIHTQTEFPLGFLGKAISGLYRIPMVHTYHTMYEDYVHYIAKGVLVTPKTAQKFSKFFCNGATYVVSPVEKTKTSLLDYGVKKPIKVIPTGLDFSSLNKNNFTQEEILELKYEIGLNENDPVVLYLGRIAKEKSIDVIVNQFPRLLEKIPNVKLVIVGNGPMLEELKQMVINKSLDNHVIFTGSRPWSEIGKYYQLGDIFVTASKSETQGLTYIEAMASKVPIVVKKDSSIDNIIFHKKNGYIFENDEEFADIAYNALTNKSEAEEIAEQGFKDIQRFSAVNFAKEMESLYLQILEDNINNNKDEKHSFF